MSSDAYDAGRPQDAPSRTGSDRRLIRLSKNQALFREVNERVVKVAAEYVTVGPLSFVCECSNTECGSQIELTHEEYERVRSVPSWFVIQPGHEIPEIENVIEEHERFAIVEKIAAGKVIAIASDPRRDA